MWVEIIGALTALDIDENENPYLPDNGNRYLLTGCDCPNQTGLSNFEVREGRSRRFFVEVPESAAICLLVCSASHSYAHYPMAEKKLAKLVHAEEVAIPTYFIFVGHRYLRHGGCGWRSSHSLRCHPYPIASVYVLKGTGTLTSWASYAVFEMPAIGSRKKEWNRM